jgi:hypothetical protein
MSTLSLSGKDISSICFQRSAYGFVVVGQLDAIDLASIAILATISSSLVALARFALSFTCFFPGDFLFFHLMLKLEPTSGGHLGAIVSESFSACSRVYTSSLSNPLLSSLASTVH